VSLDVPLICPWQVLTHEASRAALRERDGAALDEEEKRLLVHGQ